MADAIASRDEKIKKLNDYFQQQTDCSVVHIWKIDFHCHRFYFQTEEKSGWKFILDVSQDDLEEQDVSEVIAGLTSGKWQKILEDYSGKQVPCFNDKKFAAPSTFRQWPT
jgi:hypothetical protein